MIPQSKTRRPRRFDGEITRDGVVRHVVGSQGDVALVLAPAGFGKTTVVGQWADTVNRPIAWATVGVTDRDPVVLMSTIMTALDQAGLGVTRSPGLLTADEPTFTQRVLPRYQQAIESIEGPVTLVVDDIHAMSTILATVVLVATVDALPVGSQVALVGRSRPDLPVDLWRGQRRLIEVGPDDLAFDVRETRACLALTLDESPSTTDARMVHEATNGWPVGVYLQGISIQRTGAVTPHTAIVQRYLDAEVLGHLDPAVVTFLRRTAILSALSAPLCDEVLGQHDSGEFLRTAEAATLLVSRLEGPDGWYRLHPLFREHLLDQLVAESTLDAALLHGRAAGWYAERGESDEAMAHALYSEDRELIGSLTWSYGSEALFLGRTSTVRGWLDQIRETDIATTPALAVIAAWTAAEIPDVHAVERWVEATIVALGPDWMEHLDRSEIEPALATLVALGGAMSFEEAAALLGTAAQALPVTSWIRGLAMVVSGWFRILAGAVDEGVEVLRHVQSVASSMGVGSTAVEAPALIGFTHVHDHDWSRAEEMAEQSRAAWTEHDLQETGPSTALLFSLSALLTVRRGDTGGARVDLARIEPLTEHLRSVFPTIGVLVDTFAARTWALLGDSGRAREALDHASRNLDQLPASAWLTHMCAEARDELERTSPLASLTEAELRVWTHVATRETYQEIADALYLSPATVKSHLRSIYRKLGVGSRREAVALLEAEASLPD